MPASLPQDILLAGDWSFCYRPEIDQEPPVPPKPDAFEHTMPVPGWWDDHLGRFPDSWLKEARFNPDYRPTQYPTEGGATPDTSLPYLFGVGWYRRQIETPADWARRSLLLHVGSVAQEAWIWLDDTLLVHHIGPSTPFEVDLTGRLQPGRSHTLLIAVSNLRESVSGCGLRGYHGKSAGIPRPVYLRISGLGHAGHLFLRARDERFEDIDWSIDLASPYGLDEPTELRWRIWNATGNDLLADGTVPIDAMPEGAKATAQWTCANPGLNPWSPQHPIRYRTEVDWVRNGVLIDRICQPFGLRRLRRDGTDVRLNGRGIMLRGMCDHYYFPETTMAPSDRDFYIDRLRRLKEVGYNFIRFHTWAPPREYVDAADEVGMLLQPEKPVGLGIEEWRRMVRWLRRHPSVASYCYGNEEVLDEEKIGEIEEAYEVARQEDPDCLVMPMEAMRGIEYVWQPSEMPEERTVEEPFRHVPSRLERLSRSADLFGHYSWGYLSYMSLRVKREDLEKRLAIYPRPLIAHEVGISGSYLDLDLADRYTGRIPPELFEGLHERLAEVGRLGMARRYYENSARWQWAIYKHMLESLRRCNRIKGYDMLGAMDCHWHHGGYACGVLNEFLEPKPGRTRHDILRVNGENVLLLDYEGTRNVRPGERFSAGVMVSQYSGIHESTGVVHWRLRSKRQLLARGRIESSPARSGRTSTVGVLTFDWPAADESVQATLELEYRGEHLSLDNTWTFWLLPTPAPVHVAADIDEDSQETLGTLAEGLLSDPSEPTLRIRSQLDEGDVDFLDAGGTVLLLGHAPLPGRACSFQITVAGRSNGNMATVVRDHPALRHLPHEGWCDWQFATLMTGTATVFNDTGLPFDPILEVVSSYKNLHWQGLIWECRIGQGRLFCIGCHLDASDPAAAALLRGTLEYVSGDSFEPEACADASVLRQALQHSSGAEPAGTAMGFDPNAPQNRSGG